MRFRHRLRITGNPRALAPSVILALLLVVGCTVTEKRSVGSGQGIAGVMERELLANGEFRTENIDAGIPGWTIRPPGRRPNITVEGDPNIETGTAVVISKPGSSLNLTQRVEGLEQAAAGLRFDATLMAKAHHPRSVGLEIRYTSGERNMRLTRIYHPGDGQWHEVRIDRHLGYKTVVDSADFRILVRVRGEYPVRIADASLELHRSDRSRLGPEALSQSWAGIGVIAGSLLIGWSLLVFRARTQIGTMESGDRLVWKRGWIRTTRILAPITALWAIAFAVFLHAPKASPFRADYLDVIAYPMSDASADFASALALVTGDGWVDWKEGARWSVYRPGWSAILAALAFVFDRDTHAMQLALTALLALTGPAVYFVIRGLFPSRITPLMAFAATVLFLLFPQGGTWWFQNSMGTEGPALLLGLVICGVALRGCRYAHWRGVSGFLLGAVMAAVVLVRSQALYAVIPVAFVIFIAAITRHGRRRAFFLVMLVCGFLSVIGPNYLKTSIHLGMPYAGSSNTTLRGMLQYTEAGRAAGGHRLTAEESRTESAALRTMNSRVRKAVWYNLQEPVRVFKEGIENYHAFLFANIADIFRCSVWSPTFVVASWFATIGGVLVAFSRIGVIAFIPLVYSLGYIAPQVALSVFLYHAYGDRYGAPISWVALSYASCWLIILADPALWNGMYRRFRVRLRRVGALVKERKRFAAHFDLPPGPFGMSLVRFATLVLVTGIWIGGCTQSLLHIDTSPPARVDVAKSLSSPRTQRILAEANIDPTSKQFLREMEAALGNNNDADAVRVGRAFLPFPYKPDGPPPKKSYWVHFDE